MKKLIKSQANITNDKNKQYKDRTCNVNMKSINQVIRKNLILLSVIIILVVVLIINVGIQMFFRTYLKNTRIKKDEKVVLLVNEMLQDYSLNTGDVRMLNYLSKSNNINILIEDNESLIYISNNHGKMGKGWIIGGKKNINAKSNNEYEYAAYKISVNNNTVGKVYIGRDDDKLIVSKEDTNFVWTINILFIIVVLVAFLIVIIVSKYLSEKLSRPIINIKNGTEVIAEGDYGNVKIDKTDTIELNQLAVVVEELASKLHEQEILRKRMTTDIAHELRSPLAVLRSQIEAMIDGIFEPSIERLEKCYKETLRLTKLIDDLNELSTVESSLNRLNLEKVNINNIIEESVASFKLLYEKKEINIVVNLDNNCYILGDKEKLTQLMSNLLSNAYKYSEVNGKVTISNKLLDNEIVISIKDKGIGIDEKDLPYIFERLYRSDLSRNRETGGAGIGLAIVKSIVEAHRGTIEVESKLGEGTRFDIYFRIEED